MTDLILLEFKSFFADPIDASLNSFSHTHRVNSILQVGAGWFARVNSLKKFLILTHKSTH